MVLKVLNGNAQLADSLANIFHQWHQWSTLTACHFTFKIWDVLIMIIER